MATGSRGDTPAPTRNMICGAAIRLRRVQVRPCKARTKAVVRTTAKALVLVHLAVHHKIIAGRRVTAIAVDRTETQPHVRARR